MTRTRTRTTVRTALAAALCAVATQAVTSVPALASTVLVGGSSASGGSRLNATAPWHAGARVVLSLRPGGGGGVTESCTIGVRWVVPGGATGFLTAGHCVTGAIHKPYAIIAKQSIGARFAPWARPRR